MTLRNVHDYRVADTARITGDVRIGRGASIWYGVVIRGDVAPILIGEQTNVQDNAVVHCDRLEANVIGARVTIGHGAVIHGRGVGDDSLIGMGAVLLGGSIIGKGCLVAAGSIVPPNMVVPDGKLVMGVPGKIVRDLTEADRAAMADNCQHYVMLAEHYVAHPEDVRVFEDAQVQW